MKISIVSSYDDLCGNASYTRALETELKNRGHNVEILDLKRNIFNDENNYSKNLANKTIDIFIEKIKESDYVNFQLETVLYGKKEKNQLKRIEKMIQACKNNSFSVTIHRLNYKTNLSCFSLNSLESSDKCNKKSKKFKLNKIIRFIKNLLKIDNKSLDVVVETIKLVNQKHGLLITHTEREKNNIIASFPKSIVVDHPLSMNSQSDIQKLKKELEECNYKNNLSISDKTKNIGLFGFISEYKDFETAITALTCLPKEYNIYIFGGQHPMNFLKENSGSIFLKSLIKLVDNLNLNDRVHFMGAQDTDEQMLKSMIICDYVVLPYLECGQSGSAVAAMALESSKNIFLSRNLCFKELKKYTGESFFSFDMGNYRELAEKILNLPNKDLIYKNRELFLKNYNIKTNIDKYLSIFDK